MEAPLIGGAEGATAGAYGTNDDDVSVQMPDVGRNAAPAQQQPQRGNGKKMTGGSSTSSSSSSSGGAGTVAAFFFCFALLLGLCMGFLSQLTSFDPHESESTATVAMLLQQQEQQTIRTPAEGSSSKAPPTLVVGFQSGGDYGWLAVTHLVMAAFPGVRLQLADASANDGRSFGLGRIVDSGLPVEYAPEVGICFHSFLIFLKHPTGTLTRPVMRRSLVSTYVEL